MVSRVLRVLTKQSTAAIDERTLLHNNVPELPATSWPIKAPVFGQAGTVQEKYEYLLACHKELVEARQALADAPPFTSDQVSKAAYLTNCFKQYTAAVVSLYDATN